jgi:hypothetical protein
MAGLGQQWRGLCDGTGEFTSSGLQDTFALSPGQTQHEMLQSSRHMPYILPMCSTFIASLHCCYP